MKWSLKSTNKTEKKPKIKVNNWLQKKKTNKKSLKSTNKPENKTKIKVNDRNKNESSQTTIKIRRQLKHKQKINEKLSLIYTEKETENKMPKKFKKDFTNNGK